MVRRTKKILRAFLIYGFFVLLALIFVFALWKFPEWQAAPYRMFTPTKDIPKLVNEYRRTLAQIIGGFLLLIGLYFTLRRVTAIEKNVEVAQEGQITERFTRAIEQLGSDKLPVCLGGIYALERIAKDSEKDHWTVMEVLTAYVREKSPWMGKANQEEESTKPPPLPTDIQAVLTVIGRRKWTENESEVLDLNKTALQKVNLIGAHLKGAKFIEANLKGARLDEAHLEEAHLHGAKLEGASLQKTHLKGAKLHLANLERARLNEAHLEGATLQGANLEGVNLREANLKGAYLQKANLKGARLNEAHMERAHISEANLERGDLRKAKLQGVDLYNANLKEANLHEANLEGANLQEANLEGVNLQEANLKEANLSDAVGLTQEQIEAAHIDEKTKYNCT